MSGWCVTNEPMAAASMAADFESACINVDEAMTASIDVLWSGGDGTTSSIVLQGSNDKVNWCDVDEDPCVISGAAGHHLIDMTQLQRFSFWWMRAKFVSGDATTGMVTVTARVKRNRTG